MPAIKTTCPSCAKIQGVPLVWGDVDLLDEDLQEMIGRGGMVCGGDAISIDDAGRSSDQECLCCGTRWTSGEAKILGASL